MQQMGGGDPGGAPHIPETDSSDDEGPPPLEEVAQ